MIAEAISEPPASHTHRSGGKAPKPIPWNLIRSMAAYFCPAQEICAALELSYNQVNERCKEEHGVTLGEYLNGAESRGKAEIRRQQFLLLQRGNAAMAKWMGMQHLGQAPVVKITHKVQGGPTPPADPTGFGITEIDEAGTIIGEVVTALPAPNTEASNGTAPSKDNPNT